MVLRTCNNCMYINWGEDRCVNQDGPMGPRIGKVACDMFKERTSCKCESKDDCNKDCKKDDCKNDNVDKDNCSGGCSHVQNGCGQGGCGGCNSDDDLDDYSSFFI